MSSLPLHFESASSMSDSDSDLPAPLSPLPLFPPAGSFSPFLALHSPSPAQRATRAPGLSLQGSRGCWGSPQLLLLARAEEKISRWKIPGRICNPAMVLCSWLTCNPRATGTGTACLPQQLHCSPALPADGRELPALQGWTEP